MYSRGTLFLPSLLRPVVLNLQLYRLFKEIGGLTGASKFTQPSSVVYNVLSTAQMIVVSVSIFIALGYELFNFLFLTPICKPNSEGRAAIYHGVFYDGINEQTF